MKKISTEFLVNVRLRMISISLTRNLTRFSNINDSKKTLRGWGQDRLWFPSDEQVSNSPEIFRPDRFIQLNHFFTDVYVRVRDAEVLPKISMLKTLHYLGIQSLSATGNGQSTNVFSLFSIQTLVFCFWVNIDGMVLWSTENKFHYLFISSPLFIFPYHASCLLSAWWLSPLLHNSRFRCCFFYSLYYFINTLNVHNKFKS